MGKKMQKQVQVKLEHSQPVKKPAISKPHPQSKPPKLQPTAQPPKKQQPTIPTSTQAPETQPQPQPPKPKKPKRNRLIIRNLVFDINEKHIKKLIAPFGEIKEINIPRHPDRNTTKGFAFVEMASKISCLKAIKKLNGTTFKGRPIVLDLAVSKENFMTEKLKETGTEKKEDGEAGEKEQEEEISNSEGEKVKKEEHQEQSEEENEEEEQNQNEEEEAEQQEQQQSQGQKLQKQIQDHKCQIFIRNLPISTTEDDLYKHFIKHGKIKFVRVCKNKQTNVSKGTAFIKFYDPEVPEKLIHYSRSYEMFLLKKLINFVPDPNIKLEIDGIIMKIFPVETRTDIEGKLKERSGEGKKEVKVKPIKKIKKLEDLVKIDIHDKRKLSLSLIGQWKANDNMSQNDYELLKAHEKQKIKKLKNPNSSVSATRVILKHLEKTIAEDEIRGICYKFLDDRGLTKSALTYCKLMLEKDMKKSAGFAFVEFRKHETAKEFIEMLVKSPQIIQKKLYIVQFAIQDSRKMLKLAKKNVKGNEEGKKEASSIKKVKERTGKGGAPQRKPKTFKKKFIKK